MPVILYGAEDDRKAHIRSPGTFTTQCGKKIKPKSVKHYPLCDECLNVVSKQEKKDAGKE